MESGKIVQLSEQNWRFWENCSVGRGGLFVKNSGICKFNAFMYN